MSFNLEAYKAYSPVFVPAPSAVTFGLQFASVMAVSTHTFLYYRKHVLVYARRSLSEQSDEIARLMSIYKEVPNWWYLTIFSPLTQLSARFTTDSSGRTDIYSSLHVRVWCCFN